MPIGWWGRHGCLKLAQSTSGCPEKNVVSTRKSSHCPQLIADALWLISRPASNQGMATGELVEKERSSGSTDPLSPCLQHLQSSLVHH